TLTLNNPEGGDIEVVIYNLYGQEIKRFQAHGGKEVKIGWDATDAMGNELSSGIYFARARTSQSSQTIKLMYLK
ncbi:MAG: T9SS type A sorting domain-containing protein, partial [candidate division Zixibacteria bacterium]|nr:T9SS type A sorting domain-containing protein [candidate division Zixibacteria bacterium]